MAVLSSVANLPIIGLFINIHMSCITNVVRVKCCSVIVFMMCCRCMWNVAVGAVWGAISIRCALVAKLICGLASAIMAPLAAAWNFVFGTVRMPLARRIALRLLVLGGRVQPQRVDVWHVFSDVICNGLCHGCAREVNESNNNSEQQ